MATGAITTYVPEGENIRYVAFISIMFAIVNAPSITVWVTFGTSLRRWLTDVRHLRIFNILMAVLLLLSLYPLLFH